MESATALTDKGSNYELNEPSLAGSPGTGSNFGQHTRHSYIAGCALTTEVPEEVPVLLGHLTVSARALC